MATYRGDTMAPMRRQIRYASLSNLQHTIRDAGPLIGYIMSQICENQSLVVSVARPTVIGFDLKGAHLCVIFFHIFFSKYFRMNTSANDLIGGLRIGAGPAVLCPDLPFQFYFFFSRLMWPLHLTGEFDIWTIITIIMITFHVQFQLQIWHDRHDELSTRSHESWTWGSMFASRVFHFTAQRSYTYSLNDTVLAIHARIRIELNSLSSGHQNERISMAAAIYVFIASVGAHFP